MTTAILSIQRVQRNLQAKVNSIKLPTINWKTVCFIGFFTLLALLVFYVLQVNVLTRGFYVINGYEQQISKLSDENKNLQISFAESSFLDQALLKIQALNFQKTISVKYIKVPDGAAELAKAR